MKNILHHGNGEFWGTGATGGFSKNRPYKVRLLHTNFWTSNSGPKLEIWAHLGTKIAITFFFFFPRLEANFLSQIVQKRETRLSRPFFLVPGIIFAAIMVKIVSEKNTCRDRSSL
jgi:hypothetical protein